MSHNTLDNYYKTIFALVHVTKFCTLTEIENMIPFEIDIYAKLIQDEHERKIEEMKASQREMEALTRSKTKNII